MSSYVTIRDFIFAANRRALNRSIIKKMWTPMLATPFDLRSLRDGVPYFVSEKYDGVRAAWDGERLVTRTGKVVPAPAEFLERLPKPPPGRMYDGEIFAGRGGFRRAGRIARGKEPWDSEVSYKIFDVVDETERSFEKTFAIMRETVPREFLAPQIRMTSANAAIALFARLVAAGAEGAMVRRGDVGYVPRRSTALMKLKAANEAEAVVVGGGGGDKGGFLECRWNGESTSAPTFRVWTAPLSAPSTPPSTPLSAPSAPSAPGDVIVVRYTSLHPETGAPRRPIAISQT